VEEVEEAMAAVDAAITTIGAAVVAEEASTILVPARHQRVDSAPLSGTMCLTMDTRQLQTR